MELGQSGALKASREYLTQESIIPGVKDHCLIKVQHMVIWIRRAVVHGKRRNNESARRLVISAQKVQF